MRSEEKSIYTTDTMNANRLVDRHGADIRYVSERRAHGWMVWDGSRWATDTSGNIIELAKDTAAGIFDEVGALVQGNLQLAHTEPRSLAQWAVESLDSGRLNSMARLAQSDPKVVVSVLDLDTDPYLLNCTNGTVDLRTGELREPRREDLLTKSTGIEYDPNAKCPHWEEFISWAMQGNKELIEFMQLALGMSLTGDTTERLVFFLHGGGKNGKSVTLKVIRGILGDYALRVQSKLFEATKFKNGAGSASPEIAELKGKRFICTSEIEDGTKLATALLKDMTGDENMSGRFLYENLVEFKAEFKPWIAANHKPEVPAEDQAVWDRMRLIPFDARVTEDQVDRLLGEKLLDEAPGILAWAVRGCLQWQKSGMTTPAKVMEATAGYRAEMDYFADYLDATRERIDAMSSDTMANAALGAAALREHYNEWAKANDHDKLSQQPFAARMTAHGWTKEKDKHGWYWEMPAEKRTAIDFAEMMRASEARGVTPDDEAQYLAELRQIDQADWQEAEALGYPDLDTYRDSYQVDQVAVRQ